MRSNRFSFCVKCVNRITKKISGKIPHEELTGCKKLTKKEWDSGLDTSREIGFNQNNCPVLKQLDTRDKQRIVNFLKKFKKLCQQENVYIEANHFYVGEHRVTAEGNCPIAYKHFTQLLPEHILCLSTIPDDKQKCLDYYLTIDTMAEREEIDI